MSISKELRRKRWRFCNACAPSSVIFPPDFANRASWGISSRGGPRPGWLYDLVYTAKEPRVTGLGLTALRDCVSFFRYSEAKDNPLTGLIQKACVFGVSQSGRVIHHFLYEWLHDDESARIVFDDALIHVSGSGKGMFNHRFRMSTEYGTQREGHFSSSEFFPLAPLP